MYISIKTQHIHVISFLIIIILLFLPSISSAIKYKVINNDPNSPGGFRFRSKIGTRYTLQMMKTTNFFIWDIFRQYSYADRKPVENVTIIIRQFDPPGEADEAYTYGEEIHVNALVLADYQGDLRWKFTLVIHHEMAHVLQWYGDGNAPPGLSEGVAQYMMLKSSYWELGFVQPGQGERWDQGYDITARFLQYCDDVKPGFVAGLNMMMRYQYDETYFQVLTGIPLDQLWADYKAKYSSP